MIQLYTKVRTNKDIKNQSGLRKDGIDFVEKGSVGQVVERVSAGIYLVEFDHCLHLDPIFECKEEDLEIL